MQHVDLGLQLDGTTAMLYKQQVTQEVQRQDVQHLPAAGSGASGSKGSTLSGHGIGFLALYS